MFRWRFGNHDLDLTHRGLVMGIVNVTPDSFSDGGRFNDPGRAVEHADQRNPQYNLNIFIN
jgi:dihydropteroate synthase